MTKILKWSERVQNNAKTHEKPEENVRLWYQGPSYTVFRKCLHYRPEIQWKGIEDILDTIKFSETKMTIEFPDGEIVEPHAIKWTWWDEGHHWIWEFPYME